MLISPAYAQGVSGLFDQSALVQFLPLVLIFVVFYFLLIRPQQKKQKDHRAMLETLRRGDRVALDLDLHAIRDLDREELLARFGDPAEDAAGDDDLVADAERRDHGLVLLRPLRLRPDQQEVEHDENQHQRQHLQQRIGLRTAGRLGMGARDQPVHQETPVVGPGIRDPQKAADYTRAFSRLGR